jgi:hypothetical protein
MKSLTPLEPDHYDAAPQHSVSYRYISEPGYFKKLLNLFFLLSLNFLLHLGSRAASFFLEF